MGTSTDGQISFGYVFEDGFEFPWLDEAFDDDHETWWKSVNGYVPPFQPYSADTETGYADGFSKYDPRIGQYFDHQREWEKANPLPFEPVNYCSGDYPAYLLAVPGTCKSARRGYPEAFDPASLVVDGESLRKFMEFLDKFNIEHSGDPQWFLSSYWG